ncbi:MAG: L-threonylcarbamoyladenylate synthase [Alphaproteobacteria bacterium]|nr:L-threonylcarbamoyladenylate synthase [Alphaproteobacteria bacterium]
MSEHLYTYIDPPNPKHIERVLDVLRHDGVIAMSAGPNWVFAADPASKRALQRIRALKPDHPDDRPFSLIARDVAMAATMATVDGSTYKLLKRIWPGSFTVLLKSGRDLPRILATKRKVVGVRVPDDALAMLLVERWGGPLLISTVPRSDDGQHRTLGYEVYEAYGNALDLVVDLGEPLEGTETTVLDVSDGELVVIREGAGDLSGI